MKTYLVIYLSETGGDVIINRLTTEQIKEFALTHCDEDFAIIEGNVIKNFDQHMRGL